MIIDCISDLHGHFPILEGGDLLVVAGDLTARDTIKDHDKFFDWLALQKYEKKIYICGNHDNLIFKSNYSTPKYCDAEYLCDSGAEFEGLKIWGSPWTKRFEGMNPNCKAFTVDTEEELAEKWALIPDDIDILVTHSPPYGIFDKVENHDMIGLSHPPSKLYRYVGSETLRNECMIKIKPKIHCFGHIHECGGNLLYTNVTKFINCSHVNERYEPVNKPVRVIL